MFFAFRENYKFLIFFIYIICNIENAFINFSFSPIFKSLKFVYSISEFDIYYFSVCYSMLYPFMNFPANYIIEHKGVRKSLLIFSFLQMVCCFFRLFINDSLVFVYLGQTIAALACPFGNNVVSKISMKWFNPKQRMISTSLMTSSYMLGTGLTFIFSIIYVDEPEEKPDINNQRSQIYNYLFSGFFLSIITFVIVLIFYKDKPEKSSCFVANYPREQFWESFKLLIKNRNYIYLCGAFSLQTSNFCVFVVYINFILTPFGFTAKDIAYFGTLVNFACFLGKVLIGFLVLRIFSYKTALSSICLSLFLMTLGFLLSLLTGCFPLILVFSFFFGFFLQMYWSPSYEFACELIFPVGEANANGGLILSGCVVNVLVGFAFSQILFLNEKIWVSVCFAYFLGSTTISFILFKNIKEELNREKKEVELKEKFLDLNQMDLCD